MMIALWGGTVTTLGGIIDALLCDWNFLHPRQYAVPHMTQKLLSFPQFQMSLISTRTHLVLLSISNVHKAVLCLPRF